MSGVPRSRAYVRIASSLNWEKQSRNRNTPRLPSRFQFSNSTAWNGQSKNVPSWELRESCPFSLGEQRNILRPRRLSASNVGVASDARLRSNRGELRCQRLPSPLSLKN